MGSNSSRKLSGSGHPLLQMVARRYILLAALVILLTNFFAVLLIPGDDEQNTSKALLFSVAAIVSCALSCSIALVEARNTAIKTKRSQHFNSRQEKPAVTETVDRVEPVMPSHGEDLKTDSALDNKHWLQLVEECVQLLDELDENKALFDASRKELAEHTIDRLQELLERSGVEVILSDSKLDRLRHQPVRTSAKVFQGMLITETISPGFAVGAHVLRRARVRVAEPS